MGEEDSKGASRHLQIRTMQDLCSGWLILHKVCLPLYLTQTSTYLTLLPQGWSYAACSSDVAQNCFYSYLFYEVSLQAGCGLYKKR